MMMDDVIDPNAFRNQIETWRRRFLRRAINVGPAVWLPRPASLSKHTEHYRKQNGWVASENRKQKRPESAIWEWGGPRSLNRCVIHHRPGSLRHSARVLKRDGPCLCMYTSTLEGKGGIRPEGSAVLDRRFFFSRMMLEGESLVVRLGPSRLKLGRRSL